MRADAGGRGGAARRLRALIWKESLQIVRDPSSVLIAFVLPPVLLFLYGFALSLDVEQVPVALVVEDDSPEARSFADAFRASRYFDARLGADRREFTDELVRGTLRGIVVIPETFSQDLAKAGQAAPVQVIADGSEPNTANFVQNYVQGLWSNWFAQRALEQGAPVFQPVRLSPRVWYNEELESRNYLVPGSIGIVLTMIGTMLTALVVSREWERGTMEALMATPVGRLEIVLGKLLPYYLLGIGSLAVCWVLAVTVFDVPFRGSLAALFLASSLFLLSALTTGLFISTVSRNQFVAAQSALLAGFLPAFLLSGFVFEISSMPLPIRIVTHIVPARYYVACLQTIFLAGDVWAVLLPNMAGMAAITAVLLLVTLRKTTKRLD